MAEYDAPKGYRKNFPAKKSQMELAVTVYPHIKKGESFTASQVTAISGIPVRNQITGLINAKIIKRENGDRRGHYISSKREPTKYVFTHSFHTFMETCRTSS